jgi:hypothetical protein
MSKKAAAAAVTERPLLGRVSQNLKMGVVGLPNVGKRFVLFSFAFFGPAKTQHGIFYLFSEALALV